MAVGVVACLIAAGITGARGEPRRHVRAALADARAFADSLDRATLAGHGHSAQGSVAVRYLARHRDGLGSPFRLADLARIDPRLTSEWRRRVVWALVARTAEQLPVPPAAAGALAVAVTGDSAERRGAALAREVSRTLESDRTPEALEALRIAALVASAEGALHPRAVPLVGTTAVLVRDRLLARSDAQRLLAAAAREDGDVPRLVAQWRAARSFASERPTLADARPDARRTAARVRPIATRLVALARTTDGASLPAPRVAPVAMLSSVARRTPADVAVRPPQPQLRLPFQDAVSLVRSIRGDAWRVRAAPLLGATDEESFVAALGSARADGVVAPAADAAVLLVAQGLRSLAQESAWHPGVPLPAPEIVARRLGLASLRFGADVPTAWRAWYAQQFAQAVGSLRDVFPLVDVTGLHVRIGATIDDDILALHDPFTRTLVLPVATGFGAVGHELLHDVDWQAARDELRRRGSYATDAAVRASWQTRTPLAAPLMRLGELASPPPLVPGRLAREARRPAELLARGGDWYLAAALARAGRSDGALTSVQDAWAPGYASATRPDAFGVRDAALASLLDAMPRLAVRAPVAGGASDVADLGALARQAWLLPLPSTPVDASAIGATGLPIVPRHVVPTPGAAVPSCSPVQQARLAPVQREARLVVDAVLAPRVRASLERWAAMPAPLAESDARARLRSALTGAPLDPSIVRDAEARWLANARSRLPCLEDGP